MKYYFTTSIFAPVIVLLNDYLSRKAEGMVRWSLSNLIFGLRCKGLNSGKPLEKPCPNCFVLACKNQAEKDFYTTLLFGLWKVKHFYQFHTGSVIPFIRISDFKQVVKEQANRVSIKPQDFIEDVHKFRLIERKQKQIYEQMALINDVKRALIYRHFHSKR